MLSGCRTNLFCPKLLKRLRAVTALGRQVLPLKYTTLTISRSKQGTVTFRIETRCCHGNNLYALVQDVGRIHHGDCAVAVYAIKVQSAQLLYVR